ncbi:carbohydrate esterase family 1 protein [Metarhizium robertsii ARSEF 23]|uniref:Carbohydrate esterase family 1 protein n=2 Tax=Metarhizium robertsii TaxID=568076 RepID=A0A0B2XJR5_METRA|nr:carbohydrate esterase family 1 protein [Metarhizium robertsii ARSEF 23]KHO11697.1 carbohydrate esterase family 1 protein [Metarhizium robertsii ARSEF 23]
MQEALTPGFLQFSHAAPKQTPNRLIMAGKMANLFALLISLVGLALAQTQTQTQMQTQTQTQTTAVDAAGTMGMTSTVAMTEATTTARASAWEKTAGPVITKAGGNSTTSSRYTRERTGRPTTTIPNPLMHNAGRRPSQPGLGKLSVVVGLATYGLILM